MSRQIPTQRRGIPGPSGIPGSTRATGSGIPGATGIPGSGIPGAIRTTGSGIPGLSRPSGSRIPATPSTSVSTVRADTKNVTSRTQVTVTKPTGQQSTVVKDDRSVVPKSSASKIKIGAPIGQQRSQASVPIPPPSLLRKQVSLQVKSAAAQSSIGTKVTAVAAKRSIVPPLEKIMTPAGPQQVLQKVVTEKRVERSKKGEIVSRNVKTIETNLHTGETEQVEEETQKLNPDFPGTSGPIKEIVTVVSEKNITEGYEARTENIVRETTKLDSGVGMDLQQIEKLVEEEKEDVQNALKINPPELVNQSPEKYPLKKKLQALRLSPENVALLEQSVIKPPISADEPLPEASPEVMAKVLHAMDKTMQPKMDPEATFNSLFVESSTMEPDNAMLSISSIAPGPISDVVVPIDPIPEIIQEEMLSKAMEEASIIVPTAPIRPPDSSFSEKAPAQPKKKSRKKWERCKPLMEEQPPWQTDDLPDVSIAAGALPKENLDATNVFEATVSGGLNNEIDKGIEYYLDCSPLQYCSRVQLRGSQPPDWFPGYVFALSDMLDGVEVAKSPSQVLYAAWRSVQPDIFPDDSIVYN